jgi:hypothetical protein
MVRMDSRFDTWYKQPLDDKTPLAHSLRSSNRSVADRPNCSKKKLKVSLCRIVEITSPWLSALWLLIKRSSIVWIR